MCVCGGGGGGECIGIREVIEEYFFFVFFQNFEFNILGQIFRKINIFVCLFFCIDIIDILCVCVVGGGGGGGERGGEGTHFYTGLFSWVISQVNCVLFFSTAN